MTGGKCDCDVRNPLYTCPKHQREGNFLIRYLQGLEDYDPGMEEFLKDQSIESKEAEKKWWEK